MAGEIPQSDMRGRMASEEPRMSLTLNEAAGGLSRGVRPLWFWSENSKGNAIKRK